MIYIVVPVFNRWSFTRQFLESLRTQTSQQFKTIVVDHGSKDGTADHIREDFPEVILVMGDPSLWWTGAVNLGIEKALELGARAVMTMNNDTLVPNDFMQKMRSALDRYPNSVIGALDVDYGTKKPAVGGLVMVSEILDKAKSLYYDLPEDQRHGLHRVDTLPGRGLLVPRVVFEKIGLFDIKTFPHYWADYDFTCNANKAGFEVLINYDAPLYIFPDESGDRKTKKKKDLQSFYNHLFGIRGGGNLRNFTRYTLKNNQPHIVPLKLFFGYGRRMLSFWLK
jgi:GT2 family glycosyltransferase